MAKSVFVDQYGMWHVVCPKKHKSGKCDRFHEIPEYAIWQGEVSDDLWPDFIVSLRAERRRFQSHLSEWEEDKAVLLDKEVEDWSKRFLDCLCRAHEKIRPKFTFEFTHLWKEVPA